MEMEKLAMCRICLVENVRMFVVVNKNLQELYEKLTDIPFVTEDRRPILACFFCFAKIKQCIQFQRKCLEAEELFAQLLNEDYEPKLSINHNQLEFYGGFNKTATEHLDINNEYQIKNNAVKEEPPDICERQDVIEPQEKYQIDDIEQKYLHNSDTGSEDDVPLIEFKTEFEEEKEIPIKNRILWEMQRVPVVRIPRLDLQITQLENTITAKQTKNELDPKIIQNTKNCTSKSVTKKKPFKSDRNSYQVHSLKQHEPQTTEDRYICDICQSSFTRKCHLNRHIRAHTGAKLYKCKMCRHGFRDKNSLTKHIRIHTGDKPYKCDICRRSFNQISNLDRHIRIHTGEKPYKCDVCQRSFNQSCDLKKHFRIHTGEKPYKCDNCQRSFAQSGCLRKHIRKRTCE